MKIAVVGRGNVGGGLAERWERAGHEVTRLGRDGGDTGDADLVLLALPGRAVQDAFDTVRGLEGKTIIDATNLVGAEPPGGFPSNAEYVRSRTAGPTVKSFNLNFARLYGEVEKAATPPGNIWCGDDAAREVTEALIRDAGYTPIHAGGLENARLMEESLGLLFAISQAGMGPFFYTMAPPG